MTNTKNWHHLDPEDSGRDLLNIDQKISPPQEFLWNTPRYSGRDDDLSQPLIRVYLCAFVVKGA
jgi:hypothetical protein